MKILSVAKTKWSKKFTCKACKAKLEVEKSDLFVLNDAVFYAGESWEPNVYFKCAACETNNRVTDAVPEGISSRLIGSAAAAHD